MNQELKDALARLETGQDALLQSALSAQQQNDAVMSLLQRLLALLLPKDIDDAGPRLDDLLGRLIAQQAANIELSKQILAGVARIEAGQAEQRDQTGSSLERHRSC